MSQRLAASGCVRSSLHKMGVAILKFTQKIILKCGSHECRMQSEQRHRSQPKILESRDYYKNLGS